MKCNWTFRLFTATFARIGRLDRKCVNANGWMGKRMDKGTKTTINCWNKDGPATERGEGRDV